MGKILDNCQWEENTEIPFTKKPEHDLKSEGINWFHKVELADLQEKHISQL